MFPKANKAFKKVEEPNSNLTEIMDGDIVRRIKEELNINFIELDGVAPFIGGSVSNGGFSRKLKMLRADIFSTLSICQSPYFVTSTK